MFYFAIILYKTIYSAVNSTAIMVLRIYKKKKSYILILEFKCVQSCSDNLLLKSSYYNDHEKYIINNLNFIKKPDSCKLID